MVFPDQIDGTAVTKISGNIPALSVTVPEGVTQYASSISYGTIEVRLPSTVKALPKYSFYAYPYNGIRSRLLERVFLSEGLDSIGEGAFSHCDHLKQLRIPSTVSFIGDGQSCLHALEAFDVDERNAYYVSRDGVLFTRDLTTLQQYPSGKTDIAYTVPEGVKTIAAWSLEDARNLRSLRLPTTLDSIGDYAFNLDTLLTDIHFTTAEPPSVGRMFYSDTEHVDEFYARCKLFVPIGAAAAYEQNATLARFSQVAEEQVDAVEAISAAAPVPVVDYDLSGRRVKSGHGLIIRRMSDGTTHKLYRSRKH
ncbi:MAG: leucine-rich repeat domain-containing protein [Alloprevotella sp.]|nr:leucine-rich repeat domain-containing protein [Alloprevotella sp.]